MDNKPIEQKDVYAVSEFLVFFRNRFLENAYRGILRREVDRDAFHHYVGALDRGDVTRIDVLGQLRYSPEGMEANVRVRGLWLRFLFRRWQNKSFFGFFFRWIAGLVSLPQIADRISERTGNVLEFHTARFMDFVERSEKMQKHLAQSLFDNRARLDELAQQVSRVEQMGEEHRDDVVKLMDSHRKQLEQLHTALSELQEDMAAFKQGWFRPGDNAP